MIKDVQAYFKGLQDGKDFSLQEVLELAAKSLYKNPPSNNRANDELPIAQRGKAL